MSIAQSELIIRDDGSIYHLKLKPGDLAQDIITVGDPDRVEMVSQHFDSIELVVQTREFKTITGVFKGKRISVISTGIGTDNIDIVFNEIDALFNVDFKTRTVRPQLTKLRFYRIGTSGSLKSQLKVDSYLISYAAIGMDGLMEYYRFNTDEEFKYLENRFEQSGIYIAGASKSLLKHFEDPMFNLGITVTAKGFYAPQNRSIRLKPRRDDFFEDLEQIKHDNLDVTNLEMETAGIYGMAALLGHDAISLNAILANRREGIFSSQAQQTTALLIKETLERVAQI